MALADEESDSNAAQKRKKTKPRTVFDLEYTKTTI